MFRFSKYIVILFVIAIILLTTLPQQNCCHASLVLDGQLLEHGKKLGAEKNVNMILRIYDDEFGGQILFEEKQKITAGSDKSLFVFEKGDIIVQKRTSGVSTEDMWVEVECEGEVMTPRLNLAEIDTSINLKATEWALARAGLRSAGNPTLTIDSNGITLNDGTQDIGKVLTSDAAGKASWQMPTGDNSLWTTSGNNIYYDSGKVGIGTDNPADMLHVDNGNLRLGDDCRIILGSDSLSTQITVLNKNSTISNFATGSIQFNTKTNPNETVPAYTRLEIKPAGDVEVFQDLIVDKNVKLSEGHGLSIANSSGYSNFITHGNYTYINTFSGGALLFNTSPTPNTDSLTRLIIEPTGDVEVSENLIIHKNITVKGGTPGADKVLTSDAHGLASWQTPATSSSLWTKTGSDIKYTTGNVSIGTDPEPYKLLSLHTNERKTVIEAVSNDEYLATISVINRSRGPVAHFTGKITIDDNTQGEGKVLTSDAYGNASWTEPIWTVSNSNIYRSSGNVGIGSTSPAAPLEIKSDSNPALIIGSETTNSTTRPGIQFKNNTSQWIAGDDDDDEIFGFFSKWGNSRTHNAQLRVYGKTSSSWGKYIQLTHDGLTGFISTDEGDIDIAPVTGNVGINTSTPARALDVNGNARFRAIESGSGTLSQLYVTSTGILSTSSSDMRLKENIKTLDKSLEKILKLQGVTFTWKANPEYGTKIGFIAQEFEKVIPELSFTNPVDGYKGINYAEVTAVLVEAVKEQQKLIEKLHTENHRLQTDNDQIISRIEKLEGLMSNYASR